MKRLLLVLAMLGGLASAHANDGIQSRYDLAPPATRIAQDIYDLHVYVMVICVLIFLFVFIWMAIAIIKHRKSLGHQPAQFHESTTVEIVWTVIPFLIVVALAVPATKTVVAMKDTTNAALTIKATGSQWKWSYDYLKGEGEGIAFYSALATPAAQIGAPGAPPTEARGPNYLIEVDHPLVVPVDTKVRIITTATDVIHSWMVPAFGVKQDAIPGFVRDTWFKAEKVGIFRGQCAELCGKDHAFMPVVVEVKSKDDYHAWVAAKQKELAALRDDPAKTWTLQELSARGEQVFKQNCVACHQVNGRGIPGSFPALDGSKIVLGPPEEQIRTVLNGVVRDGRQTAMVSWKQLSDVELAAVITYTKNAWSNHLGREVQPREVAALRAAK